MEPKFQSSFIPKGPLVSSSSDGSKKKKGQEKNLLSFIATIIFVASVILAIGVFGYKFFLKYSIDKMGVALDEARTALQSETIEELTRFDNRIIATKDLIAKHHVVTPLFEFLENSTPRAVRFNDFRYLTSENGLELHMRGEARGYAALALQADIFSKSAHFNGPIFSDLSLNERGEVLFNFKTTVSPDLVSYTNEVERLGVPAVAAPVELEEEPESSEVEAIEEEPQN